MPAEQIITVKIDVSKIDKAHLYKGKKGTYLDVALLLADGGEDKYGNNYMVIQSVSKEARERGVKGPILGNAKIVKGPNPAHMQTAAASSGGSQDDDNLPF